MCRRKSRSPRRELELLPLRFPQMGLNSPVTSVYDARNQFPRMLTHNVRPVNRSDERAPSAFCGSSLAKSGRVYNFTKTAIRINVCVHVTWPRYSRPLMARRSHAAHICFSGMVYFLVEARAAACSSTRRASTSAISRRYSALA